MSEPSSSPQPLPLSGKTILITRAAGQSSQFKFLLEQQGALVLEMPAIEITPPSCWDALDEAIEKIQEFNWLILTSTNGVDYFFDRFAMSGKSVGALAGIKIAVVGQKTAALLQKRGIQPDFIPPNFVADSLIEHFPDRERLANLKILFPRVETGGRDVLVSHLKNLGGQIVEVPAYESACVQSIEPEVASALLENKIDVITFASSKTVRCFHQLVQGLKGADTERLSLSPASQPPIPDSHTCLASIGPQTTIACQKFFGRVDIEAAEYTFEGLTQAIVHWVRVGSNS